MDLRYSVLVDGSPVKDTQVMSVNSRWGVNEIPELELMIRDGDLAQEKYELTDKDSFPPGKPIEVKAGFGDKTQVSLFKGIIVGNAVGFNAEPYLKVTALGEAAKLCQARVTQLFDPATKDNVIIEDMFAAAGAAADKVDPSDVEHHQYLVVDQSPWAVIMDRMVANGFVLAADNETNVVKLADAAGDTLEINLAMDNCIDFELASDGSSQLKKVEYNGWGIKDQKNFANATGEAGTFKDLKDADKIFGWPDVLRQQSAPVTEAELKAKADGEATFRAADSHKGRVLIRNHDDHLPKKFALLGKLKLSGIGKTFGGEYLVTGISQMLDKSGWFTEYQLGLSLQKTLWNKDANLPATPMMLGVIKPWAKDEEGFERIPVELPNATGGKDVWARLLSPFAGNEEGMQFQPDPNTEVLVDFIGGDARFPVIVGSVHNPKAKPKFPYDDKLENRGIFFKEKELEIKFNLKEPQLEVMGSKDQTITFGPKVGYKLAQKDMATLEAKEKMTVVSKDKATIELSKNMDFKASSGNCTVTAKATEIK